MPAVFGILPNTLRSDPAKHSSQRPCRTLFRAAAALLACIQVVAAANLSASNLRCEYLTDPAGIDETQPRLSWLVDSPDRGERQTAWQVLVASTAEILATDQGDLWNSGKVAGNATSQVVYAGTPLVSREACFWKVRSWNKDDQASPWSAQATWSMGLLDARDWSAKWIDGATFGPAAGDPPVILAAYYEAVSASGALDVTAQLTALAAQGNYVLSVTNATFGSDPSIGHLKQLRVQYQRGGATGTKTFAENATIVFPADLPSLASPVIQSARYESVSGTGFRDVTSQLVALAQSGSLSIVVNNTNFGPDPALKQVKRLRVNYTLNGIPGVKTVAENATFNYPADLPQPVNVAFNNARYESVDGTGSLDVTADLSNRATTGTFTLTVNNTTFGSDPALNHVKRLRMDYQYNGRPMVKYVAEGAVLNFPADLASPSTLPYLRKSFAITKLVRQATLYATALGLYELQLNGKRVGDHILAPDWTDYSKRVRYQAYDVTSQLTAGDNVLGAQVANGWYCGHIGNGGNQYWGASPALLAQLEITYTDGTSERVISDGSWKMQVSPTITSDFMLGEDYDATHEIAGWASPGLDDSAWSLVLLRSEPAHVLNAQVMEPVRKLAELTPQSLTQPATGKWTYDLGQNMVGVVRLKITAAAGTRLTLRHAEMLNPNGTVYTANLRSATSTDSYICKGGGEETWQPKFTFHGFRYVELTGVASAPPLDAVTGINFGSDNLKTGAFACSDGFVNQLYSNIQWGQRGNYLSVPTDCPQRDERLGWMGDAEVFVKTATCNADIASFFTKWLADVTDAQLASGSFTDVSPNTGTSSGTPAWGDAGVICPWTIYQAYGDLRLLGKCYPSMVKWVEWCRANSSSSIRVSNRGGDYGDWLSINADTNKELIGTAYYAYSARLVSKAASALGKSADAATYEALFQTIKTAFINKYVNASTGAITGNTQCAYAMALKFDLLPDNLRGAVAQLLENDVIAKGNHLSTGFVGVSYLLPQLTAAGKTDTAYRLLLQDTFPSWLFSVKLGATTIWERWDGWTPQSGFQNAGMNSFNHYSLGSCGEWLFGTVAGIDQDPASTGYQKIIIHPQPGSQLTSASASLRTIRGRISSSWHQYTGGFTLDTEIPANTSAVVFVPATAANEVMESGQPASSADGVTYLRMESGAAVFAVNSGRYHFTTGTTAEPGADTFFHDPGTAMDIRVATLMANDGAGPLEFLSAGPLSVNGGTVTVDHGRIHYIPRAGTSGSDFFTYSIRDSQGGVSDLTVKIGVIPPDAPVQQAVSIQTRPDGSRQVMFSGPAGRIYRVQSSETLDGAWTTRATVQAGDDGSFSLTDPQPLPAARFYRAVFP
ncbi:MAG: family 78 glycoside hydrolase catalytic domain [Verrucomicrobiota bacterium]